MPMRQNADMTVFFANENTCDCESRIDGEYRGQNKRLIVPFYKKRSPDVGDRASSLDLWL